MAENKMAEVAKLPGRAEIIECADKLGTYCRGKDCDECPFYDVYNDCVLELERPGMWDLEYLLKKAQDDDRN